MSSSPSPTSSARTAGSRARVRAVRDCEGEAAGDGDAGGRVEGGGRGRGGRGVRLEGAVARAAHDFDLQRRLGDLPYFTGASGNNMRERYVK